MFLIYSQKLHKMFLIYFALSYRVSGLLYCFILFFLLKLIFIFFIFICFVLIFFLLLFFKNFALHHLVSFNFYIKFDFYFFIVVFILVFNPIHHPLISIISISNLVFNFFIAISLVLDVFFIAFYFSIFLLTFY